MNNKLLVLKSEILQDLEKLDHLFEDEKFAIVASKTRQLKKAYKNDCEKFLYFIDDLLED